MNESRVFSNYFYVWAIFLPVTSFLLVPSVQGTTIAYVFALASIAVVVIVSVFKDTVYLNRLFLFVTVYGLLYLLSQFGLLYHSSIDLSGIGLVDPKQTRLYFRSSSVTQSIYLLSGVLTFLYVRRHYRPSWDRYIYYGAIVIAVYGFYEVIYFQLFNANGDFISNRMFGEHTGSWFQTSQIGSLTVARLKSLTGEPSMAAFTLLPYWIYAVHKGKSKLQWPLLAALLLTTSTTAYVGIALYAICRALSYRVTERLNVWVPYVVLIVAVGLYKPISYYFTLFVWDKFFTDNISGMERQGSFDINMEFYEHLPVMNKLFGIGFGTIRSTDMFSTLLVNVGIVGVVIATLFFVIPILQLKRSNENTGIRIILIVIYVTMMMAVPEFAYLPTWLFLGIAYKKLADQHQQASEVRADDNKRGVHQRPFYDAIRYGSPALRDRAG